jgi:ribonuclease R
LKKDKTPTNTRALDKARVLELLATNAGANKRDLAKLLGLKGSDRIVLKRILKELEADGAIEGRQKKGFLKRGELPDIGIIEITGQDEDGETLARPLAWDSNEEPPAIYVLPLKDGAAPGPGDRLLARLERHGEAYEARVIRRLERETRPG